MCGYRGTGKSSVAAPLAERLGWSAVDTDRLVEAAAGMAIAEVFARHGEAAFRDLEQQAVATACQRTRVVVALGGGAVLREANRRRIREAGRVVWLTASPATLAARLAADSATGATRPALTDLSARDEVEAVLAQRAPLYRGLADLELETENRPPGAVAAAIARWLAADAAGRGT